MRTLIIGATGKVGRETVRFALEAGDEVRAFGRSIASITIESPRLEKFRGDVMNASDLDSAMVDIERVILAFGAPLNKDTILHKPDLTEKGTVSAIEAMKNHNVTELVAMTAIGAGDSKGHGRFVFRNLIEPVLLDRIMQDRTEQEKQVRASGIPKWVIVRPTELTDGEATQEIRVIEDLNTEPEPTQISRANVGWFLAQRAAQGEYWGKTILISN
ncbi:MAG: NAD(P)H-binding protein [Myxococcota bacterium]